MAMLGIDVLRTTPENCRHRRAWVVSHLELQQGTDTTNYAKFRQCRRCGEYLERLA
ncbi:MAG: hypothetical protein AAF480_14100 [Actinomycetota bacterium]